MRRHTGFDIIRQPKAVRFVGSTLKDLDDLPNEARERLLTQIERVQVGLSPHDWKPMVTVGPGVREIRVRTGRQFRALYVAGFSEAIYVLHVFEKKSQRTAQRELQLGIARFRALIRQRREEGR